MHRRSREQILVGILKSCASDSFGLTRLMSSQNLSYRLLKSYLDGLLSAGLVRKERNGDRTLITTTDRGVAVLRCYRSWVALLNGNSASCPLVPIASQRQTEQALTSL